MTGIGGIEKVQRSDFRKLDEFVLLKLWDTEGQVIDGREWLLVTRTHDRAAGGFVETADVAKTDAEREKAR